MATMDDSTDPSEDDTNNDDASPAIPTQGDDTTDTPDSMSDAGDTSGGQPGTDGPSDNSSMAAPGAAQSSGSKVSELQALIRAVSQYGFRMAQGQGGQPQDAQQQPQSQSFEFGGMVLGFDEGGAIPATPDEDSGSFMDRAKEGFGQAAGMVQGAIDTPPAKGPPEQAGPWTPKEEALNTREKALDKSGLGGAFKQAQEGKIGAQRQDIAQNGDPSTQPQPMPGEQPNPGMVNAMGAIGNALGNPSGPGDMNPEVQPNSVGSAVGGMASQFMQGVSNSSSGKAAKGLIDYLKGKDAMDGQTASAVGYAVDPLGNLPPVQKSMKMVQYAYMKGLQQDGDPRTAMQLSLGVLQHQRQTYDMWRTGAAVKLDQSDVGSAIQAANKAFQGPFGDSVHFAATDGGKITATVTDDQGNVQGQFPMYPAQFGQLLKSHGKFDSLVHNGIFDTLAGLSVPTPTGNSTAAPGAGTAGPATAGPGSAAGGTPPAGSAAPQGMSEQEQDAEFAKPNAGKLSDAQVQQYNERHFPILRAPAGVDPQMFAQSRRLFPNVGDNDRREAWIAQQQEQEAVRKNKTEVAAAGNNGRNYRAELSNQTRRDINTNTQEHQDSRATQREEGRDKRFTEGWQHNVQAAAIKAAAAADRNDPTVARKTAIVKAALAAHFDDPAGFLKEIEAEGLNYERDVLHSKSQNGAAQQTPQTAPQVATGQGASKAKGAGAPPEVGTVQNGFRFKGGNPAERSSWERAE